MHLNLEQMQKALGLPLDEIRTMAKNYLHQLRKEVNTRLSSFLKLTGIREQTSPFEQTPTLKIKRFLYEKKR